MPCEVLEWANTQVQSGLGTLENIGALESTKIEVLPMFQLSIRTFIYIMVFILTVEAHNFVQILVNFFKPVIILTSQNINGISP